jgi:hypothetical protein
MELTRNWGFPIDILKDIEKTRGDTLLFSDLYEKTFVISTIKCFGDIFLKNTDPPFLTKF